MKRINPAIAEAIGTAAFKKWFSGSKVVSKDGMPLIVYHGSNAKFKEFKESYIGQTDDGYYGRGFYFTGSRESAESYGRNVYPVYLKIKKPFLLPAAGTMGHDSLYDLRDQLADLKGVDPSVRTNRTIPKDYHLAEIERDDRYHYGKTNKFYYVAPDEKLYGTDREIYGEETLSPLSAIVEFNDKLREHGFRLSWANGLLKDALDRRNFHQILERNGYDGIIVYNPEDDVHAKSPSIEDADEFIVWHSDQIKSVDNDGSFDADDRDIYSNPQQFWGRAAAGILFLCKDDGTIMLLKRSEKVMEPGTWGLPGGKLEGDEDPFEGAKRETKEELRVFPRKFNLVETVVFESGTFKYTSFVLVISRAEKERIIRDHQLNWENDDMMWEDPTDWDLHCPHLHFGVQYLLKELAKR